MPDAPEIFSVARDVSVLIVPGPKSTERSELWPFAPALQHGKLLTQEIFHHEMSVRTEQLKKRTERKVQLAKHESDFSA